MKLQILIIALLLVSSIVMAAPLDVTILNQNQEIIKGNDAHFTVEIKNNQNKDIEVTVKSLDLNWLLEQDLERFLIGKSEAKTLELIYQPLTEIGAGKYGINLVVMTEDTRIEKFIPVRVLEKKQLTSIELLMSNIDPRKDNLIKIRIKNKHEIDLDNLHINFISNDLQESQNINLQKGEEKEVTFNLKLDPKIESGNYPIQIEIKKDDEILNQEFFDLVVGGYTELKELEDKKEGLLYKEITISKTNSGNKEITETFIVELGLLEKTFTSFNPEPEEISKTDGRYTAKWERTIEPNGEISISYTTNYRRPLFILLVLIAAFAGFYLMSKRSVTINKKVIIVRKDNLCTLKVNLTIKNNGNRNLKYLKLMDRIPNVTKSPSAGNAKVHKEGNSNIIVWDIKSLGSKSELNFNYTVEIKRRTGGMLLPPAVVRYTEGSRRVVSSSNTTFV